MVVGSPLKVRNLNFLSKLKLENNDICLSTKLRNLGKVSEEISKFKYHSGVGKKKPISLASSAYSSLMSSAATTSKFVSLDSRLKHVYCIALRQIDSSLSLIHDLPNLALF